MFIATNNISVIPAPEPGSPNVIHAGRFRIKPAYAKALTDRSGMTNGTFVLNSRSTIQTL
ncbi:MAG: hypothetical protein GVY20_14015 [Bacteroidetes bacterium]|nr:hypothetical protein [Bacteroidota bacterium]